MTWERTAKVWVIAWPECAVGPDGRYKVPATELEYGASDGRMALLFATQHLAAQIELPPWKPWMRELAKKATVERKDRTVLLSV